MAISAKRLATCMVLSGELPSITIISCGMVEAQVLRREVFFDVLFLVPRCSDYRYAIWSHKLGSKGIFKYDSDAAPF